MELLKQLCAIAAPSGDEGHMNEFLLDYIRKNNNKWKVQPEIYCGEDFQDCIVLIFGKPRTSIYAHIDNIGFTVRYSDQLVKIGGPHLKSGTKLVGQDSQGTVQCEVVIDDENHLLYKGDREIDRGTNLSYFPDWREDESSVQCCYMDNRLGVWNALKVCETLENGAIVFSCWEEHGGGSVPYLSKFLFEKYGIRKALISDITWITEGVHAGKGVVISMRDTGLPRRKFLNQIIEHAQKSGIPFQLEVEGSGGSDGTELQKQPYPIDWCFIGAAEENVHSPDEKVNKKDITAMVDLYKYLMKVL
ncbi:MAG: M20/M25/M40 family metallo-hydrolase [Bacteroidetes bacterium]|nr:M20/M25/M40 family metallo-hydrolase [Bacteroidota bacterium]